MLIGKAAKRPSLETIRRIKQVGTVNADDLIQVCREWGFDVQIAAFAPFTKEI